MLTLKMSTKEPASAEVLRRYYLEVPVDCDNDDDLIIRTEDGHIVVRARAAELIPDLSELLSIRLGIAAQSVVGQALVELKDAAEKALRSKGY